MVFGRGGVSPDSSGRARRGELHLGRRMSLTWARERAALRMGVGRRRVAPGVGVCLVNGYIRSGAASTGMQFEPDGAGRSFRGDRRGQARGVHCT